MNTEEKILDLFDDYFKSASAEEIARDVAFVNSIGTNGITLEEYLDNLNHSTSKTNKPMKLYTEEQVIRAIELSDNRSTDEVLAGLTPIELPSDGEIEEISKHEILYNDAKRSWWIEGAKYVLNIIKIK
jgi:hypothetical protein